jgi:hypothetical protein
MASRGDQYRRAWSFLARGEQPVLQFTTVTPPPPSYFYRDSSVAEETCCGVDETLARGPGAYPAGITIALRFWS